MILKVFSNLVILWYSRFSLIAQISLSDDIVEEEECWHSGITDRQWDGEKALIMVFFDWVRRRSYET